MNHCIVMHCTLYVFCKLLYYSTALLCCCLLLNFGNSLECYWIFFSVMWNFTFVASPLGLWLLFLKNMLCYAVKKVVCEFTEQQHVCLLNRRHQVWSIVIDDEVIRNERWNHSFTDAKVTIFWTTYKHWHRHSVMTQLVNDLGLHLCSTLSFLRNLLVVESQMSLRDYGIEKFVSINNTVQVCYLWSDDIVSLVYHLIHCSNVLWKQFSRT